MTDLATPPTTKTIYFKTSICISAALEHDSRLGSILGCIVSRLGPEVIGVGEHPPDQPPYSTVYLQRMHMILNDTDGVIAGSSAYCVAMRDALYLNTLNPCSIVHKDQSIPANRISTMTAATAKAFGLLPAADRDGSQTITEYLQPRLYVTASVVSCTGQCWIKDRTIAAVYKSTLQTAKRLTRGRR